jgi:hypothetical protein
MKAERSVIAADEVDAASAGRTAGLVIEAVAPPA